MVHPVRLAKTPVAAAPGKKHGAHGAPYATNHSYLDDSIVVRRPAGV